MATIVLLVELKILNPKVRRQIYHQAGSCLEDAGRYPGGLSVLQTKKDNIFLPRRLGRSRAGKPGRCEWCQCGVDRTDRLSSTAAAGRDALSDVGVLQQEPQELSGDVTGASDNGDLHG